MATALDFRRQHLSELSRMYYKERDSAEQALELRNAEIHTAYLDGMDTAEIAKLTGISRSRVYAILYKYGVKFN